MHKKNHESENRFVFPAAPADLSKPDIREKLTPAGLKAFFRLIDLWGINTDDARELLGGVSPTTFSTLKKKVENNQANFRTLKMDELQRISLMIGIMKALRILHNRQLADDWMRLPNTNPIFKGRPPVEYAVSGGIPALGQIRKLLDARRGMLA